MMQNLFYFLMAVPILSASVLFFFNTPRKVKSLLLAGAGLVLLATVLIAFSTLNGPFSSSVRWIPQLGMSFELGLSSATAPALIGWGIFYFYFFYQEFFSAQLVRRKIIIGILLLELALLFVCAMNLFLMISFITSFFILSHVATLSLGYQRTPGGPLLWIGGCAALFLGALFLFHARAPYQLSLLTEGNPSDLISPHYQRIGVLLSAIGFLLTAQVLSVSRFTRMNGDRSRMSLIHLLHFGPSFLALVGMAKLSPLLALAIPAQSFTAIFFGVAAIGVLDFVGRPASANDALASPLFTVTLILFSFVYMLGASEWAYLLCVSALFLTVQSFLLAEAFSGEPNTERVTAYELGCFALVAVGFLPAFGSASFLIFSRLANVVTGLAMPLVCIFSLVALVWVLRAHALLKTRKLYYEPFPWAQAVLMAGVVFVSGISSIVFDWMLRASGGLR